MYVIDDIDTNISIEIGKRRCQMGVVCMEDRLLLKWNLKK
jgi:hypothetical protein